MYVLILTLIINHSPMISISEWNNSGACETAKKNWLAEVRTMTKSPDKASALCESKGNPNVVTGEFVPAPRSK